MLRKFLIYFFVCFIAVFAVLNYRLVSAELRFWLAENAWLPPSTQPDPVALLPLSKSAFYLLNIPSLQVKAPVVLEESLNPDVIFNRLEDGAVHYADSVLPGELGTAIILGHSSAYPWYKGKYGSVFALLGHLKKGDEIVINNGQETLKFKVTESLVFNPFAKNSDVQALEQTDTASIVLVSCWPVGTSYRRIAVRADLVR